METVGKFEFNRKDLIGHGAFAVVFKGRHREKHDWEVAVKCINKKNLAKSQTLLGKEIKILKELKHENIVALLDFQETASSVYLVMEYCNGGDLADYLHSKGTLSEDTIRVFLQQIAGAMKVLQSKGIIHRDLKPQNILLSYPAGRKSHSNNTCIKIADFGFARYLQNNMMAATLCGSPMYMAPEVIMSQTYDAKADLWSLGTIVFQCLTGKAPFQASSPQDLRLFYEKNKNLSPNIPRETSSHLRHLLQGLLQRNHKDRMDYDEFFCHPFLEASSSMKKSTPTVTMTCFPSSASASSCSSSSTSHLASPPQSLAEVQHLRAKALTSPTQEATGFLLKDSSGGGGSSKNSSSCDTDDFVMVPAHITIGEQTSESKVLQDSLMNSGSLLASSGLCSQAKTPSQSLSLSGSPSPVRPSEFSGSNFGSSYGNRGQSSPIPVPTQVQNYQRMEQNLHSAKQDGSPRLSTPVRRCSSGTSLGFVRTGPLPHYGQGAVTTTRRFSLGGGRTFQFPPQAPQHTDPRPTSQQHPKTAGLGTRLHSAPCLLECVSGGSRHKIKKQHSDPVGSPSPGLMTIRPLHSSPRLSELMQRSPLPTILGSPSRAIPPFEFPKPPSSPNLVTFLTQQGLVIGSPCSRPEPRDAGPHAPTQVSHRLNDDNRRFGRSQSAGGLSDVLLMAAFGAGGPVAERGSTENLTSEKAIEMTVPPGVAPGSSSPARVVFTVGSPPSGSTPPHTCRQRKYSGSFVSVSPAGSFNSRYPQTGAYLDGFEAPSSPRYSFTDPITANIGGPVTFEAPELPEETLMEQEHTDAVQSLRFTLDFARCLMEVAGARGVAALGEQEDIIHPSLLQQQSLVADQISSLSQEWSHAEQLVLYLKTAELLSTALHTTMERVKQGKLYPSTTVKQVVKRLNELYKMSVASCRALNTRLECFFSSKHRLMDQITSITAERLLFSHTVQMVQAAALDEMFHQGEASVLRYHKALLLMEGLSLLLTEQKDILVVSKCKECIERRLTALQSGLCV
ncbi:serine serine/threonine-protein kinase ULK1 isoform X1 [Solea senegalensis]|uniref:non-specific serine/threonine protein kinase n=1 Tax=Solea senegalensis TaxID=28829 RepID=A0AAV6R513_SOLSE|nr:serine/threonine-protein kinase ULK1 isoform X1 [Solea senegalensis]KAG7499738.1 serine serine/threonine-protein kinase ULK1 isoform X1 [Solea senegalensis]